MFYIYLTKKLWEKNFGAILRANPSYQIEFFLFCSNWMLHPSLPPSLSCTGGRHVGAYVLFC